MQLLFRLHGPSGWWRMAASVSNLGPDAVHLYAPRQHNPGRNTRNTGMSVRIEVLAMYAVIRTGGKQYLVSPGREAQDRAHRHFEKARSSSPTSSPSRRRGQVRGRPGRRQGHRHRPQRGPRRQDPGLQAEAQEAVQEDAGTPPELRRGPHQRDRGQRQVLQGRSLSPKPRPKRSPRKRPPRRLKPQRNSRKGTRLRVPNSLSFKNFRPLGRSEEAIQWHIKKV